MSDKTTTTYSMWSLFRNCRKACEYRYIKHLVPIDKDPNLHFGGVIHDCLEIWHGERRLDKVLDHINLTYSGREQDEHQKADWHLAKAMMSGYAERYPTEEFDIVALEKTFQGPIVNPATGAASKSFVLAGKVDGIVKQGGKYYLLEHKTAARIDSGYLDRLWIDFQIIVYSWYLEQTLCIDIEGVIYNILVKTKIQQGKGESEEEFEERKKELIAKSKTGKTSAKRKIPESDKTFQERLQEKYKDPNMFHREMLTISRDQFEELRSELWELSKALLDAKRRGVFYRNTSFCFKYNRPCPYFPLCRSGELQEVVQERYHRVLPHGELQNKVSIAGRIKNQKERGNEKR